MLTQARLKELLHYNQDTGIFTWVGSSRPGWNNKEAGSLHITKHSRTAYKRVGIDRKLYLLHRLAYLYIEGHMPNFIDHIDGIGINNKFSNLRECTNSQNICNVTIKSNNKSGVKNVHWEGSANKWRGTFCTTLPNGKRKVINVGLFVDLNDAEKAVAVKRQELHKEFANHK